MQTPHTSRQDIINAAQFLLCALCYVTYSPVTHCTSMLTGDNTYDIIISGAGPAGCTAALALKDSGLKVAVLEKEKFPRDKVCGDAIPARAVKVLKHIDPQFAEQFSSYDKQLATKHTDVIYGKNKLQLHWQIPAYTCARLDFDNYLFELVKKYTDADVFEQAYVKQVDRTAEGYSLIDKNGNSYHAKLVIGADGAQSVLAKKLGGYILDREHHIGSVRAYYENVKGVELDKTEMYMDKRFSPGYFWIFPIAGGKANVGFGMISADIASRKLNLKQTFYDFIETVPALKERFGDARQLSKLDGHSLPLGSKRVQMSGDSFMLCGDAASLIDPITGEGVGNAMLSSRHAALQAISCFENNHFSAAYMKQYDDSVWQALGSELRLRTRAQKLFRKAPALLDVVFAVSGWEPVRKMIQEKF